MAESPSQKFARLREAAGLTQEEAAGLLNVHAQTISRWERGQRQIKATDMDRAVALFGEMPRAGLGRSVSRETPYQDTPAGQLMGQIERDVIRRGATDLEADFLLAAISTPQAFRLCTPEGGGLSTDDYAALVRSLMRWLDEWVAHRRLEPERATADGELVAEPAPRPRVAAPPIRQQKGRR